MAAVKASLEEDLSRAHSELRDTRWELVERERALGEWEREAGAAREESKSLKSELDGVCEERERERREFGEKEEKMVEEMKLWVEVREQRWLMEREALENQTVELSLQLEMLRKTAQRTLEEGQQLWEREREEEREGWAVEAALLQEHVSGLTEELEAVTGRAGEYERDIEGLREAVEKAQSLANTLQVSTKRFAHSVLYCVCFCCVLCRKRYPARQRKWWLCRRRQKRQRVTSTKRERPGERKS